LTIAPGTTNFVIVRIERFADVRMIDKADVGLINAHAKGIGGDNHRRVSAHEAILDSIPFFRFQAAVIEDRVHGSFLQFGRDQLGVLMRGCVDNSRLLRKLHPPQYGLSFFFLRRECIDAERNVRAVKTTDKHARSSQSKFFQ
jgi:hypothetical protein